MEAPDSNAAVDSYRQNVRGIRQDLRQRLAVDPLAHSADGHVFGFQAPIVADIPTGAYVRLTTSDGTRYLGQVLSGKVIEYEGPELNVEGDAGLGIGGSDIRVAQTAYRLRLRRVDGEGVLLGRLVGDRVEEVSPADLFEDAQIALADDAEVERYLSARIGDRVSLDIGVLRTGTGQARARLLASGFDRHTFLCGQSGSGKTFSLGVILERLLMDTSLRIVIIDPNSDFVRLGEVPAFEEVAGRMDGEMDAEMYGAVRQRYMDAAAGVHLLRPVPRGTVAGNALRVRFSDLAPIVQGMVLQIDPLSDLEEYSSLRSTVERLGRAAYSLADIRDAAAADLSTEGRRLALRISNLGVAGWDLWAERDEPSLADAIGSQGTWRALVLDVGGFSNAAEKSLIASGMLEHLWNERERRQPILIVADEAHNICAQDPPDPFTAAATDLAVRIAGEGRKFGLYLLMATQRPQKLHANVLSQCDNLVLMRMNSSGDLAHLASTFSFVSASLIQQSASFRQGEALVAGKIVPTPLMAKFSGRISREGGSDIPTTWASAR